MKRYRIVENGQVVSGFYHDQKDAVDALIARYNCLQGVRIEEVDELTGADLARRIPDYESALKYLCIEHEGDYYTVSEPQFRAWLRLCTLHTAWTMADGFTPSVNEIHRGEVAVFQPSFVFTDGRLTANGNDKDYAADGLVTGTMAFPFRTAEIARTFTARFIDLFADLYGMKA
ncbi:MAG: hypothetical protein LUE27_01910 [Clostridia bacterium]|nr:hypothetical protein [Clostridia bacterium]